MQDRADFQLADQLRFNPKWWWDPIPDWYLDDLGIELRRDILNVQLQKQARLLEVQLDAVKETMKLIGR